MPAVAPADSPSSLSISTITPCSGVCVCLCAGAGANLQRTDTVRSILLFLLFCCVCCCMLLVLFFCFHFIFILSLVLFSFSFSLVLCVFLLFVSFSLCCLFAAGVCVLYLFFSLLLLSYFISLLFFSHIISLSFSFSLSGSFFHFTFSPFLLSVCLFRRFFFVFFSSLKLLLLLHTNTHTHTVFPSFLCAGFVGVSFAALSCSPLLSRSRYYTVCMLPRSALLLLPCPAALRASSSHRLRVRASFGFPLFHVFPFFTASHTTLIFNLKYFERPISQAEGYGRGAANCRHSCGPAHHHHHHHHTPIHRARARGFRHRLTPWLVSRGTVREGGGAAMMLAGAGPWKAVCDAMGKGA